MKVSIALATYNGEKFIEKQLNSLLNQTVSPSEVIICDDCSKDKTTEIINNFISKNNLKNWLVYKNTENLGFKKNFHKAVSLCTGDIIFTCDQDDIWCEEKTQVMLDFFKEHPNANAVSSSFSLIDENDSEIVKNSENNYGLLKLESNCEFKNVTLKEIIHSNISPGCTAAFTKNVAGVFLNNSKNILPHDYEINIIAASLGGLYFINKRLIKYRIHSNNALGFNAINQTRLQIANEKLDVSFVIKYTLKNSDIYNMQLKRVEALSKKSIFKILKLNFNKSYGLIFTPRERLGDILYTIRREK